MSYYYFQEQGGEEKWKPCPAAHRDQIVRENNPTFCTVLSVSKLVEDLPYEEKQRLKYAGPFYADWDGTDIADVGVKFNQFLDKLEVMKLDLNMVKLFATGGKGFHLEVPEECFMEKVPKDGTQSLPTIYRELALELFVDTLDLRVYSQGMGRMWRCPNKIRANDKYKVEITPAEARTITVESYAQICSAPRQPMEHKAPQLCLDLSIMYARAQQKVDEKIKKRLKSKPDPLARDRAASPSIGLMMQGSGIKGGVGFQNIALQLAIAATTAGTNIDVFVGQCQGLIETHESDGTRYNTAKKREEELRRMYQYVEGNPMYEFSVGAIKAILTHTAPDLDGIAVEQQDIVDGIAEAEAEATNTEPDEYADVAAGVTLSKYGIYVDSEFGKKRVCAVSFSDIVLLKSCETGEIIAYKANALVNGRDYGRKDLELDVFTTVMGFNKFCARLGHAYSGSELQLRGAFMRFVEQAKKKGGVQFITKREGLDVISISNHDDPELRKPFLVWSDSRGVVVEERLKDANVKLQFLGYPDTKGTFKTDISDAPKLVDWISDEANKNSLKRTLTGLFKCQEPVLLAAIVGWYTACFWRMLFHKAYDKFPVLHVAGAAGGGKTELNLAMMSLFYTEREAKSVTPSTSIFAVQEIMSGSSSIPLMFDEYKLEAMPPGYHGKMKEVIRNAYNCRDVSKGGGSRDNNDYRVLHNIQLSAPLLFIAEAEEEESATMERVVLAKVLRPPASVSVRRLAMFQTFRQNKQQLAILGQYLAADILKNYSVDKLREEFEPLYTEARDKYRVSVKDVESEMSEDDLITKQNTNERTVFNYTVVRFGLRKMRNLIKDIFGEHFEEDLGRMEDSVYDRMNDLQKATQAEYLKVLSLMSTMSYAIDPAQKDALRKGQEYAFTTVGGQDVIEISARMAYIKYRMFCRSSGINPMFPGHESFCMALKDSSAFVRVGAGSKIQQQGVYTLKLEELTKLRVEPFKP